MPWAGAATEGRRRAAPRAASGGAGQAGRRPPSREDAAAVLVAAAMDVRGTEAGRGGLELPEVSITASSLQLRRRPWQTAEQR